MAILNNVVATLSSGTSLTVGPFTTSGTNRLIKFFIGYAGPANQASTRWNAPVRDGQTFTILDDGGSFPVAGGTDASDHYCECWVLANPNTTNTSISLTSIGGATLNGVVAWAVIEDNAAQSGWAVTRVTLDRDATGDPTTVSGSATLTTAGSAVAFAWGSNQGTATWGTPTWTAGTELLASTASGSGNFARGSGAYLTGTGSKTFTWNTALSGGGDPYGVARLLIVDSEIPGTIVSVGDLGTGASSTSSTTLTMTTATAMSAGQTAFLGVYSDNTSTTDGNNAEVTSVSGGTGTWTELGEYTNGNAAAAAGATVAIYRFVASGTVAVGTTITVTFASARVDKCCSGWIFSSSQPLILDPDAATNPIANVTDAANGFGSAAFSGLGNRQHLFIRVGAKEANSTTQITPSSGFAAFTVVRSRNNASAILGRGEWDIDTGTGSTSNPTLAVTGDTAALFVALVEQPAAPEHATTGALVGQGAAVVGSAARTHVFSSTGALVGQGAVIAGSSQRNASHAATGALVGTGATVAGSATLTAYIAPQYSERLTGILYAPLLRRRNIVVAAGTSVSHATSGELVGQASIVSGSAARTRQHGADGALVGQGAALSGTSTRFRSFGTAGALVGQGAVLAGVSARNATHSTVGELVGGASLVSGSASRYRAFASSGALVGSGAEVVGSASRGPVHVTSGALVAQGAVVAGSASRFRAFGTAGALVGSGAMVAGSAQRLALHLTTGALVGQGAVVSGATLRYRSMSTAGVLIGSGAEVAGAAQRVGMHTTSGALVAGGAILSGSAGRTSSHVASGDLGGSGAALFGAASIGAGTSGATSIYPVLPRRRRH